MASLNSSRLNVSSDDRYQAMLTFGASPLMVEATRIGLCYAPVTRQLHKVAIVVSPALDRPDARLAGRQKGLLK